MKKKITLELIIDHRIDLDQVASILHEGCRSTTIDLAQNGSDRALVKLEPEFVGPYTENKLTFILNNKEV